MNIEKNNKAIVRKFFDEACNNRNDKIIDKLFSSNVRFNGKSGSPGDVRKFLEGLRCDFEDLHVQVNEQIANDNRVFTLRTWTGKKKRKENDVSPANKRLVRTEASVVTIENDKIVEDWVVRGDFNELLKQWLRYVQPDEYLSLWQFYQNRADQIKDRLWTSATLHFTILAVILGFSADKCLNFSRNVNNWVTNAELLIALSIVGLLASLYTGKFVQNYGRHINSIWDKADELKHRIVNLSYIDHNKNHDDSTQSHGIFEIINERLKIPFGDARHLYWITIGFFVLYMTLLSLGFFAWIQN